MRCSRIWQPGNNLGQSAEKRTPYLTLQAHLYNHLSTFLLTSPAPGHGVIKAVSRGIEMQEL